MAKVKLYPDGRGGYNEMYTAPASVKEANEWFARFGVERYKFGTSNKKVVIKDLATKQVIMQANNVRDLCYFLIYQTPWMIHIGLGGYDWYPDPNYRYNTVTICLNM